MRKRCSLILLLSCWCLVQVPAAVAQTDPGEAVKAELLGPVETLIREAKNLGASKHCPRTYDAAVAALQAAEAAVLANPEGARRGTVESMVVAADIQARRVLTRIRYINELRDQKHGWEEAALRYDRLIEGVATVSGIVMPPALSGPDAGRALVDSLSARRADSRARMDSLVYVNRDLNDWVSTEQAVRDTQIERLQDEITLLRHQLWETELRAGMAEADRDEAHHRASGLVAKRELVRSLGGTFTPEEGEVLLTPDGDVRVRVAGLRFASGSAWLNPEYDPLLDRLAEVIRRFPGAPVTVEGHTDNTGERQANLDLSAERAIRVAQALAARLELPADGFTVLGVGPDHPVADNSSASGRILNRRIEILLKEVAQ